VIGDESEGGETPDAPDAPVYALTCTSVLAV